MFCGAFERCDYTASFHIDYPDCTVPYTDSVTKAFIYTCRHKQIT